LKSKGSARYGTESLKLIDTVSHETTGSYHR
jgi:hypothetical protein